MRKIDEGCINPDTCKKCGGYCCKKSGCDYYVNDFPFISKKVLINKLDQGETSITSALQYKVIDKKMTCTPVLFLRARNIDRDIIDLFSMKKQCMMLRENGCAYEVNNRPGGGLNLIPKEDGSCYPKVSIEQEIKKWMPYQKLLAKLVKYYSGLSLDEKFRQDVETMFYKLIIKDTEGVSDVEIKDILSGIKYLMMCYPEEYFHAKNKALLLSNNNIKR